MVKYLRKRNNRKGFSLTELLVAVLILSMVSAVVAGGIPVARDAYEKITVAANAQVMLSTTISMLRNELSTASDVKDSTSDSSLDGKTITYYSPSVGNRSKIYVGKASDPDYDDQDTILFKQYADYDDGDDSVRTLVSKAAGDGDLYVFYDSVSYDSDEGTVTFEGLKVINDEGKEYAQLDEDDDKVKIRLISP